MNADQRGGGHVLRVLDLDGGDLDALFRDVDEIRAGQARPLGRVIGANVSLAGRHIRCGVRDASTMLGCVMTDGSWDELARRCVRAELLAPDSEPAVLIGVDPDHARLEAVAERSPVPVLNAGSNLHQPLQVLADIVTLRDFLGPLRGRHVLLVEDDLALRRSWAEACVLAGMRCTVAEVTTNGALGAEFRDAVAYADLFGGDVRPISEWDVSLADVDVVVGTRRQWHRFATVPELLRTSDADTIVLPGRIDADDADAGHAGEESARAVLFHRSRTIVVVAAALIRRAVAVDAALV